MIDKTKTLWQICVDHPKAVDFLVDIGFSKLQDANQRKALGSKISLTQAVQMKGLNPDKIVEQLEVFLDSFDKTDDRKADLSLSGLLPCPVRLPLMESFEPFINEYQYKNDVKVDYNFQAASAGASWMEENINSAKTEDELPDLFISAGFETFFDKNGIGKFKDSFKDNTKIDSFNKDFDHIELRDPDNRYSIISVVPAVFLVNTKVLGDEPIPETWEDLLDERFEGRVSLPVGDFDLFTAILLDIQKRFGDEAVVKMGKSLKKSLHPAEMVKSEKKKTAPAVTIMPYFFTKMVKEGSTMKAVWPKDGAIISPIFMLTKKSKQKEIEPIIDLFASKDVGEILSHKGLFPSVHPDIDNKIDEKNKYSWLGWDYINSLDVPKQIKICEELFNKG